ncbi:MAG: glycosyltransferase family 9 protein, partial [Planctomycetota bacterium]
MRIRLLREAGGLGDVVRCLGVARSIRKCTHDAELWFYTLAGYGSWARLCPDVAKVVEVGMSARRRRDELPDPAKREYLRRHGACFDATVDMYCPAWRHEVETQGNVMKDRIDIWTEAAARVAGLDLKAELAWLSVPDLARGRAEGRLEAVGVARKGTVERRRPLVGVQALSCGKQRSLSREQVFACVEELKSAGADVIFIHSRQKPVAEWGRELGCAWATGLD